MNKSLVYKLSKINNFLRKKIDPQRKDLLGSNACGDVCIINIKQIEPIIKNMSFQHEGCILSKSVVNALFLEIQDKNKEEAINILDDFLCMTNNIKKKYSFSTQLLSFKKFNKFASRKSCMTVGAKIILSILNES